MSTYLDLIIEKMEKAFVEEDGPSFAQALAFMKAHKTRLHHTFKLPDLTWIPNDGISNVPNMGAGTYDVMLGNGTYQEPAMRDSSSYRWSIRDSSSDIIGYRRRT